MAPFVLSRGSISTGSAGHMQQPQLTPNATQGGGGDCLHRAGEGRADARVWCIVVHTLRWSGGGERSTLRREKEALSFCYGSEDKNIYDIILVHKYDKDMILLCFVQVQHVSGTAAAVLFASLQVYEYRSSLLSYTQAAAVLLLLRLLPT